MGFCQFQTIDFNDLFATQQFQETLAGLLKTGNGLPDIFKLEHCKEQSRTAGQNKFSRVFSKTKWYLFYSRGFRVIGPDGKKLMAQQLKQ